MEKRNWRGCRFQPKSWTQYTGTIALFFQAPAKSGRLKCDDRRVGQAKLHAAPIDRQLLEEFPLQSAVAVR